MNSNSSLSTAHDSTTKECKVHTFRPDYLDDKTLWDAFRKGDEQAFITLFDRFVKILYTYGVKLHSDGDTVKDTVQELFIELWKNRKNLGDTDSIKLYLYKSLRRKIIRLKSKQSGKLLTRLFGHHEIEHDDPYESVLVAEQSSLEKKQRVMNLLTQLSNRQREAVFLRYFEELEYDKIATIMDLSKQVVYNLVNKAIQSLRK